MRNPRVWIGLATGALLLAIVAFGGPYFPFLTIDHAVYWSTARINLEGGNPYDTSTMLAKQGEVGLRVEKEEAELMMYWYPPWSVALIMPLGFLSHQTSQVVWYLCGIGIVMFAAGRLWLLYGGEPRSILIAWAVTALFSPFWSVLFFGQISPLMLLGATIFLILIEPTSSSPNRDLIAGAGLSLLSIKPAMCYLFWPALLLWLLKTRRWYVAGGAVLAMFGGLLVGMITNPGLPMQFLAFISNYQATLWGVATVGSWLRSTINPNLTWLQFVPLIFGLSWCFFYWQKHRSKWVWKDRLPVILLASLITTPFAWTHDQVILLPAITASAVRIVKFPRLAALSVGTVWLAFNLLVFILHFTHGDQFFFWQAPLILLFYAIINLIQVETPKLNTA